MRNMNVKGYRDWLNKTDFLYKRFDLLASQLTKYLLDYQLTSPDFTQEVVSKFEAVLTSCDKIDYQENSTATAYGILHFLPRFHRFQLTFGKLIDKSILPLSPRPINVLDVGTGSGPSLFALSDIYLSLQLFGEESGSNFFQNQTYEPDYVERSSGFRNWLHHFTEVANLELPNDSAGWTVPYHYGNFEDFNDIKFETKRFYERYNRYGKIVSITKTIKHRFNIVVFSNFLTQISQVNSLKEELQYCMRFMRNNGKLIISGGTGVINSDKDYPRLYERAREILLEKVYSNYRLRAEARYIKVRRNKLSFGYKNRFGERIKDLNKLIIERFTDHGAIDYIPEKTRNIFMKSVEADYDRPISWEFHVFEKSARLKEGYKSWNSHFERLR